MSIQAAPRQVKYTKPRGMVLRVMDDYIPYVGAERGQYQRERWMATQGASPDRDWTGKGVGCYHGTDNRTGRAILCEGKRCKFLPKESRPRPNTRNRPENARTARSTAARPGQGDAVVTYLRGLGFKGPVTSKIRALAIDAIEHKSQIADYLAAA